MKHIKNFKAKMNENVKCIVDNNDYNYAKENDELHILNYLKMIGDDIKNFNSENCEVKSCVVNFGDYSVLLETKITSKDKLKLSKDFNKFCQNFDWCDKKTLIIDESNGFDRILWDSTILINPDYENEYMTSFTEFDIYDDILYITIRLDG